MSLEQTLYTVLTGVCPRVYPDVAPAGTATPYITYQQVGGQASSFTDGSLPDRRNASIQVNVWDKSRLNATTTMLQVEQAICSSVLFQATPDGAHIATFDDDTDLRGCMQDFSIWALR